MSGNDDELLKAAFQDWADGIMRALLLDRPNYSAAGAFAAGWRARMAVGTPRTHAINCDVHGGLGGVCSCGASK